MKKMIFLFGMLVSLLVISPVYAQYNFFLMVPGIVGTSTEKNHQGWIQLFSYKEGFSRAIVADKSGSRQPTSFAFAPLIVTKAVDQASVKLKELGIKGLPVKEVIMACALTGGTQPEIYRIRLMNAIVSEVKANGSTGATFMEEVTFNYTAIEWKYVPIDNKGYPQGEIKTNVDVNTLRSF
jgi:type VI secretion system Hcp family effector